MLFFEVALQLSLFISLFLLFLSLLFVIAVYVAILTHTIGIEFLMRTVPRLFVPSVLVVAITTHALSIVFLIRMATIIHFFSKFPKKYIFFLEDLRSL